MTTENSAVNTEVSRSECAPTPLEKSEIIAVGWKIPDSNGWGYSMIEKEGDIAVEISGPANEPTMNRAIIHGLMCGVSLIRHPMDVTLVTTVPIGLARYRRNQGSNLKQLRELIDSLEKKGCRYRFLVNSNFDEIRAEFSEFDDAEYEDAEDECLTS